MANRNRYLDLLRVICISVVVGGHWILTDVIYRNGMLSGHDAMAYISWSGWATLPLQIMPVFFLVGGYAAAISWGRHSAEGESWLDWVRGRAMRLIWPTAVYLAAGTLAATAALLAGALPSELARAGWLIALQLWFLPAYMLLIIVTPVMYAAHRRWGLAVPAVMAAAAALVDVGIVADHRLATPGYVNFLFVWGSMYQWGFAWQDGTLTARRWRPWALAVGGAAVLAALLAWSPFDVNMLGTPGPLGNTTPPSIALLAFAAAQSGLVIAGERTGQRFLARPRRWKRVERLTPAVMTTYLWHMIPVIIVSIIIYPSGIFPQPAIGSALWWETRPAWLAMLAVVLVPLIAALQWAQRPLLLLPSGIGPVHAWSPTALAAGMLAAMYGLTELALSGFAAGGRLAAVPLAAFAAGAAMIVISGRPAAAVTPPASPAPAELPGPPAGAAPGRGGREPGRGAPY